jgi:hypothetical protein
LLGLKKETCDLAAIVRQVEKAAGRYWKKLAYSSHRI